MRGSTIATTFTGPLDQATVAAMRARLRRMEQTARAALAREFGAGDVAFERFAEMRYRGQRHNIKVPVSGLGDAAAIRSAFERDYRRRYGHADDKAPAEIQALHLSAFARLRAAATSRACRAPGGEAAPARTRQVYFPGGWIATPIIERVVVGARLQGRRARR